MLYQVVRGLEHMHAAGVVHCDVKPQNVFIAKEGGAKIGDFDVSQDTATRISTLLKTRIGITLLFAAPEVMRGDQATTTSDMYSLGLLMAAVHYPQETTPQAARKRLLDDCEQQQAGREIENGSVNVMRHKLAELMKHLVCERAEERYSATQVLMHPYFTQSPALVRGMSEDAMELVMSSPPSYWQTRELRHGAPARLVDVTEELQNCIGQVIAETWIVSESNPQPPEVKVEKVERVENPELWMSYLQHRHRLHLANDTNSFTTYSSSLIDASNLWEWKALWQRHQVMRWSGPSSGANEALLFHGVRSREIAEIISLRGFDGRVSQAGMAGFGVYFAENSSKSHMYTGPNDHEERSVLLSRVCLGRSHVLYRRSRGLRRPPCEQGHIDQEQMCAHRRMDSVWVECRRTSPDAEPPYHREFVVYDGGQCYPEFIVTYRCV